MTVPDRGHARESGASNAIARGISLVAVAFLAFVGGAVIVLSKTFPYEFLRDAYLAGSALAEKKLSTADRFDSDLWRKARTDSRGVRANDASRIAGGYTLYTSGDGPTARLVGMDGRIAHEWHRPFSTVWNERAAVKEPQPDELTFFHKARVLPGGELLAIYDAAGDTPWGYGMVKLTKDSQVVWSYLEHVHHDFDVSPDGRIFVLTNEVTTEKSKDSVALQEPRLEDFLVVLSADGEELKKISLSGALTGSRYAKLLDTVPFHGLDDPLHANSVEFIDAARAANLPMANEGDVLLSFREIGVLAILNPESGNLVWAIRGPWLAQHAPRILPDGGILLFDNLGAFIPGNASRVIEIDPETLTIRWQYVGDGETPFESPLRGSAERLANGNTLITESDGGRLFEVTRNGELVWEYVNPIRGGADDGYIPVVTWGQRISATSLDQAFRNAIEGGGEQAAASP